MNTNDLPEELWIRIMEFLNHSDLASIKRTSTKFQHLADDEKLWTALLKRKYVLIQSNEQSQKERFIKRYQRIKWYELANTTLQQQIRQIIETYKRYSCQAPSEHILFQLICGKDDEDDDEDDQLSIPDCISEMSTQKTYHKVSLPAIVFFIENFPHHMEKYLFRKWQIWGGNDLFGLLLWASKPRLLTQRAINAIFANFSHERLLSYILKHDMYTMMTCDKSLRYTTSCFRRLIYEGAFLMLEKVIQIFGPEPFIAEIRRVDEINYTVLNELTAEKPNRGDIDIKTLDVLYKHFSNELHELVRRYINCLAAPNCFCSISDSTNTRYIKHFLRYFREEGKQFVNWCETDASNPLVITRDYEFHVAYAFSKAWCF